MPVFTVHMNRADSEPGAAAEQMILIPEKFNIWALSFGPFWLIWNRLWLALTGWIVFVAALVAISAFVGVPAKAGLLIYYGGTFLLALEANQLRRRKLDKIGMKLVDVTGGRDVEDAERRFLSRDSTADAPVDQHLAHGAAIPGSPDLTADQIGSLFPTGGQS